MQEPEKKPVDSPKVRQPAQPPLRITVHVGRAMATLRQIGKPYAMKDETTGEQQTVGIVKWARERDGDLIVEVDPAWIRWVYEVLKKNGRLPEKNPPA